ncbi:hypothetical protein V6N13_135064 [Hibiscus sabdariffa]|uniref:Pentatricopeptide repeat-containing protein n=1 Tax=Hibiscus sabdariffa TaxID=183260 RepID=A0ABR2R633_9ROSI
MLARCFEEMGRKGIGPDVVTFTTLIKAFLNKGCSYIAKTLLDRMSEMSLLPDRVFYTTIIDHLCKRGKAEMPCGVFNDMINGFCKSNRVNEAVHIYEEMQGKGLSPDETTFKLITGGLLRERKLSQACQA